MKFEWRKQDKHLYFPKNPEIITLKSYPYIKISGEGNPNGEMFQKHIEELYSLSYGVKMLLKQDASVSNYYEYTVFPLQATWSLTSKGIEKYNKGIPIIDLKDYFSYELMIRQPDFLTQDIFNIIKDKVIAKKKNPLLNHAQFFFSKETKVCQAIHIGSFDDEPQTFKRMESYALTQGFPRKSREHTEIYLIDPRRTAVEKLKTTLQFEV
ncbi:GyrI-like domain-containing protein [Mycoplasmatota bacterium]|nr:GyrI-like domain-containing protein [Mycoplasmatota bacterium]